MTATKRQVTGRLIPLDAQQRDAAILAACRGEVTLVSSGEHLWSQLRNSEAVTLLPLDEAGDAVTGTLVVQSPHGAPLPADNAELVLAHVAAGRPAIIDTVASDPIRAALAAARAEPITLVQCELTGTVLAPDDLEFEARATLASEIALPAEANAVRVILFLGDVPAAVPAIAEFVFFPALTAEHARLQQQVLELERTNRRLAEGRLGVHDAAAARAAAAVTELSAARRLNHELEERLAAALFHAKQNDELFQNARTELFQTAAHAANLEREIASYQGIRPRRVAQRVVLGVARRGRRTLRRG